MLASLKSASGDDNGWLDSPGLSKTGLFRIYYTSPIKSYFNFADSRAIERRAAQMFWLAKVFKEPVYAGAELETAGNITDIFHLLFYPDKVISPQEKGLPRACLFKGVNVGFYRSNWSDPDALYLAFKGGDNQVGHAQLDQGTFVLDWLGERWAKELGPDSYVLPGYFGKERFSYYRLKTEGQNTIAVDDLNQLENASSPVTVFEDGRERFKAVIDLTGVYEKKAGASITRTFQVEREEGVDRSVILTDRLLPTKKNSFRWHLHSDKEIELKEKGRLALFKAKDKKSKLSARITKPENAQFTIKKVDLKPPHINTTGLVDLQIYLPGITEETELVVRFSPG